MEELNVAAQLKIYVEDPSAMESVKGELGKIAKVQSAVEEEMAFGIKVLKVTLLLSDSQGMDVVEEKIKSIEKVSQVEVEGVTRV